MGEYVFMVFMGILGIVSLLYVWGMIRWFLESLSGGSVEYYPLSDRYFPMYGGKYLRRDVWTGLIKRESERGYCDSFVTREQAEAYIVRYKEDGEKLNVVKTKVE